MKQFGEIDGIPVAFSNHALQRMLEMELTPSQVKSLITKPEEVYFSRKYPNATYHRFGDHSMALEWDEASGRHVVVTVLYSTQSAWYKAQREGLLGAGREVVRVNASVPRF